MYDVIVIGAGAVGCATARELSRFVGDILVLEKGEDVCCGTSKANSAIVHAGFDALPGTKKAAFNVEGCKMIKELSSRLDFHYINNGSLVLCFDEGERGKLTELYERGIKNGVEDMRILSGDEVRAMEPAVTEKCVAALYAPTAGIVCPFGMTIAFAENAAANGAQFRFNTTVTGLESIPGGYKVSTTCGGYTARAVVNAAGLGSAKLHNMLTGAGVSIVPRKGEYCLLDRKDGGLVKRTIFQLPGKYGKGILVTPTVHGNLLIGPTAVDVEDCEDTATTASGIADVIEKGNLSVPNLPMRDVITSFAGLRAHLGTGDDFIIEESLPGYFAAVGIESPGLTAAPAIGKHIAELAAGRLGLTEKENFISRREGFKDLRNMPFEERRQLTLENPAYGNIVCRCEQISEGEIIDAIRRTPGARSLDGVKRRVRAGMGRCQGGFCSPVTMEILSRELGIPQTELTKSGGNSKIVSGYSKEAQ